MKIKLSKMDWESLASVASNISALKLTLAEILQVEDIVLAIRDALGQYFEEREKLLVKGQKFLDGYNQKLTELYKQYGKDSNHPAIGAFAEDGRRRLDEDVNIPLEALGKAELEVELEDKLFGSFKVIFARNAFFGEKGYNDNELGKAAFARTVKGLGITPEELGPQDGDKPTNEPKSK